jgi:hypothetical protein
MPREPLVRLPKSGKRGDRIAFLKLLYRVRTHPLTAWEWEGKLMRPGATVPEPDLHPEPHYPRCPIVLECATSPLSVGKPGGGRVLYVLWKYDSENRQWREIARAEIPAANWSWVIDLAPLAVRALEEQGANVPAVLPNLLRIENRIVAFLDRTLNGLEDQDRAEVLSVIHNQLAARIASVREPSVWSVSA